MSQLIKLMDAADKYAEAYEGDPRGAIQADVKNAFYAGAKYQEESSLDLLTKSECKQIAEILKRRANEIGGFYDEYRKDKGYFGSVELALQREIDRLRHLAERVNPPEPENEDDN